MVEFALILPALLIILMGIVEFGWAFTQTMEVRHAAREGARIAAVNYDGVNTTAADQTTVIRTEICRRMTSDDPTTVNLTLVNPALSHAGAYGRVVVVRSHQTLSNFFPWFPSSLSSDIEFRIERPVTWSHTVGPVGCP
ncbi:MAG: pilus assembly protein [Acidimicrobiia bacterium]|nr:pilus assembly protein [Acidimicrobiia bacterium]